MKREKFKDLIEKIAIWVLKKIGRINARSVAQRNIAVQIVEHQENIYSLRSEAHKHFDRLWKEEISSRNNAYEWLCKMFRLPRNQAHISMPRS